MTKIDIPYFERKKDLFAYLVENKALLEAQKKFEMKRGDGVYFQNTFFNAKDNAYKANQPVTADIPELKVRAIINTTNVMDSHRDVHIPGLWTKSLKENGMIMHLQEHQMAFDKIIADGDDLKAFTKQYTWKELGYPFEGNTEALVFDSNVKRTRNSYMHEQYAKAYVKNHSVGMRYVKIVLAINDEDYGAEYEAWEKYFPMVANKDEAEDSGFFWAVKEAKVVEGSAVPIGSNVYTPTENNNMKSEPSGRHSEDEPPQGTQINYKYLIDNFKL